MPVPRFLNLLNVPGRYLFKMVPGKIEKAVGCAGPQNARTRKTETPYRIGCALPQVIHRYSLPLLIDLSVWKPVNAEPGCNPEVTVRPFRQRMNDDCLRRIRVHFRKAMTVEARHTVRRSHNQKAVPRLQDVIDNI